MEISLKETKDERLLGILFVICLFIPHSNSIFLLVPVVACLFLKLYTKPKRYGFYVNYFFAFLILITFALNVSRVTTFKPLLEFTNILMLFMLFPFVGNIKLRKKYLYISLGIIAITQLAFLFNIGFVQNFLDTYYPISEMYENSYLYMKEHIGVDNLASFRLGGIFRNQNQAARYISLLLAIFLIESKDDKSRWRYVYCLASFFCVALTGSRTGFVVVSAMIMFDFFIDKGIKFQTKINVILLGLAVITFLISLLSVDLENYRFLQVLEGFSNSADSKWYVLIDYITYEDSFINLLFGNLSSTLFVPTGNVMETFDSEYGNLFFSYGLFGTFLLLLFYLSLFVKINRETRVIFIFLLWSVSSTIIFSYRTSFLFMLLLSKYYNYSIESKSKLLCLYFKTKSC